MDPKSREYLDKILAKTPEELRGDEKGFLRARRSYLNKVQKAKFEEILEEPGFLTYPSLLAKAKALGYNGPRLTRGRLESYIKENNQTKP